MKTSFKLILFSGVLGLISCGGGAESTNQEAANQAPAAEAPTVGQSGVQDNTSNPNVVQIAIGSKDHTTLVAAVKAANLVDALSNAGPFTVFAPTNAAFDKLPAGTVEGLLKPEKIEDLTSILEYHVFVGVLKPESFKDGQTFNQVSLKNITVTMQDGKPLINGKAHILASIPASNGIIHVIDEVLLPAQ
ncbi:MAG TPA: fasciclin domain-containing protein [Bacteroidia bacterium]|nr:fasciclin domain-containing protein [Bacteroidia bacterium]